MSFPRDGGASDRVTSAEAARASPPTPRSEDREVQAGSPIRQDQVSDGGWFFASRSRFLQLERGPIAWGVADLAEALAAVKRAACRLAICMKCPSGFRV